MRCTDFRELADSYLSDELLIETNHDLIRHLESCADCRLELTARRELRSKLRKGFQEAEELQMPGEFADKLRSQLRNVMLRPTRSWFRSSVTRRVAYVAIAASLVIAAALGFRAIQQRSNVQPNLITEAGRETKPSLGGSEPANSTGRALISASLTENAIGDHRDCAINHRLKETPIDLDEAGRRYDRAYINLVQAVMSDGRLPGGVTLVAAHSCMFNGQRFGHVILKYHDQLVSVLVTAVGAAQTSEQNALGASKEEAIASAGSDVYRVAHFETARHAVFVVSSLSEAENMAIARAVAPSVSKHVERAEVA
ncbi:MAG: anti-sigma factor family protein [Pyrinomonadaceae bacterium]